MKYTISPSGRDLLEKNSTIETDSMKITKFSFGVTKMDKIANSHLKKFKIIKIAKFPKQHKIELQKIPNHPKSSTFNYFGFDHIILTQINFNI